jgi:hypothetical protein
MKTLHRRQLERGERPYGASVKCACSHVKRLDASVCLTHALCDHTIRVMTPLAAVKKTYMTGAVKQMKQAMATITKEDVLEIIRRGRGNKTIREYALELGVGATYLGDILRTPPRRSPGDKILNHFGIGKRRKVVVEFEFYKK